MRFGIAHFYRWEGGEERGRREFYLLATIYFCEGLVLIYVIFASALYIIYSYFVV